MPVNKKDSLVETKDSHIIYRGEFKVGEVNKVKVDKTFPFDYREFNVNNEAGSTDYAATLAVIRKDAKWADKDLVEAVNAWEYSSAKSNEYQKVTEPYRPDTSTPEYKREQLVKNLMGFGVPEDVARQQVASMIDSVK
jgi:hypothetical protein